MITEGNNTMANATITLVNKVNKKINSLGPMKSALVSGLVNGHTVKVSISVRRDMVVQLWSKEETMKSVKQSVGSDVDAIPAAIEALMLEVSN
jgi:hypothetical protein